MKRDLELLRKILFYIEENFEAGKGYINGPAIEGYDSEIIAEHCDLLCQQGLIKHYKPIRGGWGNQLLYYEIGNMTNNGYDFMDAIRDDIKWSKAKKELEKSKSRKNSETLVHLAGIFSGGVIKGLND